MYYKKNYLFDPKSTTPFSISRSKLELFIQCHRCFYLDVRLGIKRPSFPAFTLNSAVDTLLKKEFDIHRVANSAHPLMKAYGLDYKPFSHQKMEEWRHNFTGIRYLHAQTNLIIFGAVDDIWQTDDGKLIIVDYKSTSTDKKIDLEDKWKQGYKRQMEIYQWLARHNEDLKKYEIADLGYFVYCNANKDLEAFDARLEFGVELIPYQGDDSWVESSIIEAKNILLSDGLPEANSECEYCSYRQKARQNELWEGGKLF